MFSFFKRKSILKINDIMNGKYLELAEEKDYLFFFKKWMQKKHRKNMVGTWFILYENEKHIYWAKPYHKSIFSDDIIINKLYFTSLKSLNLHFPKFRNINGTNLRNKIQQYMHQYYKASEIKTNYLTVPHAFNAELKDDNILIKASCNFSRLEDNVETFKKAIFNLVLDKSTLSLKEIHEQSISDIIIPN